MGYLPRRRIRHARRTAAPTDAGAVSFLAKNRVNTIMAEATGHEARIAEAARPTT